MTDDLDTLLTEDGARWRAAQPAPPTVHAALFREPPRRPARRWQPLVAAASVAVLAVGGYALTRTDPPPTRAAAVPTAELARMLVRDGDRVTANGFVLAPTDGPVRMCLSFLTDRGSDGGEPVRCAVGVDIVGVDLDRLFGRMRYRNGTVMGSIRADGVYRDGSVVVERQSTMEHEVARNSDVVDCVRPPGGWTRPPAADRAAADKGLAAFTAANPGAYLVATSGILPQAPGDPLVPVVGTVLDRDVARPRLQAAYGGADVCVHRVAHARTELDAATARIEAADPALGLVGWPDEIEGVYRSTPLVLDETTLAAVAEIDQGKDVVDVTPMVRPRY